MVATVVLIHGFLGSAASWSRVRERIEPSVRCLPITLVGHGPRGSAVPGPTTFDAEVDRIAACIRGEMTAPIVVCGYSMGGRVALALTLRGGVAACLSVSADPGIRDATARRARADQDEERAATIRARGLSSFVDAWEKLPLFASQARLDPAILEEQRRVREDHEAEGIATAVAALSPGNMPSMWSDVGLLSVPVGYLAGSMDSKYVAIGRELVAEHANVDLEIVDGAGHNLLLEAPERVASAIVRMANHVSNASGA